MYAVQNCKHEVHNTVTAFGILVYEDVERIAYCSSHRITQIQGVREQDAEGCFRSRKIDVTGGS